LIAPANPKHCRQMDKTATLSRLQQKRTRATADRVAADLAFLIETGVYKPGARLREIELAERFDVSRAPVREALRILATRSLVHIEPMKGASVARLSDDEVRESVEISAGLFALAARYACERATLADVEAVTRQVDRLQAMSGEGVEAVDFFRQTLRAGLAVVDAAKNARLKGLIVDVRTGAADAFGPIGFTTPALRAQAAGRWKGIVDAIISRDPQQAARLAEQTHIDTVKAGLDADD
jgi:DNA-binding GntR family transcriptional regulator